MCSQYCHVEHNDINYFSSAAPDSGQCQTYTFNPGEVGCLWCCHRTLCQIKDTAERQTWGFYISSLVDTCNQGNEVLRHRNNKRSNSRLKNMSFSAPADFSHSSRVILCYSEVSWGGGTDEGWGVASVASCITKWSSNKFKFPQIHHHVVRGGGWRRKGEVQTLSERRWAQQTKHLVDDGSCLLCYGLTPPQNPKYQPRRSTVHKQPYKICTVQEGRSQNQGRFEFEATHTHSAWSKKKNTEELSEFGVGGCRPAWFACWLVRTP